MKFSLRAIACKMDREIVRTHFVRDDRSILSARLLTPDADAQDPSAVYIVRAEDLAFYHAAGLPVTLICVGSSGTDDWLGDGAHNVLSVEADDPVKVHGKVQQIFDFYNEIDADLMKAIPGGKRPRDRTG
jgi:hypothetical protein